MSSDLTSRRFFLFLMIATAVLLAAVVRPLATALFLAAVLAGVLWPLHVRLARRLGGRRNVSAGLLIAAVVLLLVGPLAALSAYIAKEATGGLTFVSTTVRSEGVAGLLDKLPEPVRNLATKALDSLPQEPGENLGDTVGKQVSAHGGNAAAVVGAAVAATGSFLFQTAMMLIALFSFLTNGEECVAWLDDAAPLRRGQARELLAEFRKVSYAVLMSSVITSGVQALAALVGYYIAQVPRPVFFGAVTFFVAFIPAVGAASVCVGAAVLLFVTGHTYMAIFLAVWGFTVVGLVDNVVKPLLLRSGMEMNGALVFFALIGGIGAFGPIGLLLGPLVVSLALALLRMYRRDFTRPDAAPL